MVQISFYHLNEFSPHKADKFNMSGSWQLRSELKNCWAGRKQYIIRDCFGVALGGNTRSPTVIAVSRMLTEMLFRRQKFPGRTPNKEGTS
jgi:hypothetical protein